MLNKFFRWIRQQDWIDDLKSELKNRLDRIIELEENQGWIRNTAVPQWLNYNAQPYIPIKKIVTTNGIKNIKVGPTSVYYSNSLIKGLVNSFAWKPMYEFDKMACIMEIWKYMVLDYQYELDQEEDWRSPNITFNFKKGDCEDTTIFFICLAREAGFRPDEIFNACGWFKKGKTRIGHSWPIVKIDDVWYVFETTLSRWRSKIKPKKFKGSPYWASWGVANDLLQGKIKGGNQL